MSERTCKTCQHWIASKRGWDGLAQPLHPDTYEPIEMPFEVRSCQHPGLLFCERPADRNGFAVADGSQYWAALYTAEEFGCVRHEAPSGEAA